MSNEKQSPSDVVYECSNKSLTNTMITSPDSRTVYVIETPVKLFRNKPTTLHVINRGEEGENPVLQEIATIKWRCFKPDLLTFVNQDPVRVKDVYPKRWYTCLWPGRTTNDPASGHRWRGERCPKLVDREGKVLAAYYKKCFKHEAATLTVAPSMVTNMNEIVLGLVVMHMDARRRWRARAAMAAAGGGAGGS